MPRSITYGQIHQLLLALGFEGRSVKDSHTSFRHADSDTVILLALHKPNDAALLVDVRSIRRMLIDKGLLAAEDFDQFVADGQIPRASVQRSTAS